MFEFSIAKGYLWPKKKQLSISLIGLLSVFVISLVIWLVLLFLSVTEGIERNWLNRLTSLHAPIRITPTEEYYHSYYYQVDSISSDSNFTYKTLNEKRFSPTADPYDISVDEEIPVYWSQPDREANGMLRDLVQQTFDSIETVNGQTSGLFGDDFVMSGAMMRLRLIRPEGFSGRSIDQQSFITQATYLSSFSGKAKKLTNLIIPPTIADINHMIYASDRSSEVCDLEDRPFLGVATNAAQSNSTLTSIFSNVTIEEMEINADEFRLSQMMLPSDAQFTSWAKIIRGKPIYTVIPTNAGKTAPDALTVGTLKKVGQDWQFVTEEMSYKISEEIPLLIDTNIPIQADVSMSQVEKASRLSDIQVTIKGELQNQTLAGIVPWSGLILTKANILSSFDNNPPITPPWVYFVKGDAHLPKNAALLPKNFRDNDVLLGDRGYFSYGATTATSVQEQRTPMSVAGFYDPGVMAVGARCVLVGKETVETISAVSESVSIDPLMGNGIWIWTDNLKETKLTAQLLTDELEKKGLSDYWKVSTFYDYDFAKDLMVQFQSDRYLFMLIGIIILFVACCNIISLLLLLVNDKKQEIGVLLSLGAKKRHIAFIFGLCGMSLGIVACCIGLGAAYFTMENIGSLVHLLNFLEGQEAFNSVFYGSSLPSSLSNSATMFVLVSTPILSMLSGLIPAIKACRLKPSAILRSE